MGKKISEPKTVSFWVGNKEVWLLLSFKSDIYFWVLRCFCVNFSWISDLGFHSFRERTRGYLGQLFRPPWVQEYAGSPWLFLQYTFVLWWGTLEWGTQGISHELSRVLKAAGCLNLWVPLSTWLFSSNTFSQKILAFEIRWLIGRNIQSQDILDIILLASYDLINYNVWLTYVLWYLLPTTVLVKECGDLQSL